ncbi:MAG: hypothetical protein ACUVRS_10505 [Armatimonadota bacterium]
MSYENNTRIWQFESSLSWIHRYEQTTGSLCVANVRTSPVLERFITSDAVAFSVVIISTALATISSDEAICFLIAADVIPVPISFGRGELVAGLSTGIGNDLHLARSSSAARE